MSLTRDEFFEVMCTLLPRGRAWQTNRPVARSDSVLHALLYALAGNYAELDSRLDAAVSEARVLTTDVDRDLWLEEYGLPDDADPWGVDVAAKVAATQGGTSLDYFMGRAAALGFATAMRFLQGDDPEFPGVFSTLHVVIYTADSPRLIEIPAVVDIALADVTWLGDPPSAVRLTTALTRLVPAHVAITYELI